MRRSSFPVNLACAFGLYTGILSKWYHGETPYEEAMPVETCARWCAFMGRYRLSAPASAQRDTGSVFGVQTSVCPDAQRQAEA